MAQPHDTADLVATYTAGLAARTLTDHGVASGLGVWLLLALLAPAAQGEARSVLEQSLGTDAIDAQMRAQALLATVHPEVAEAVAVWARDGDLNAAYQEWANNLPADVGRGPVPTQAEADRWVAEHTRDLISKFPLEVGGASVLLASALVTTVRWEHPFQDVPVPLGGPFADAQVLLTPWFGHEIFLADTATAGRVAVHRASSKGGLLVTSVIADPQVSAVDVHAAALAVDEAQRIDPFDLDLGDGHSWTVNESIRRIPGKAEPIVEVRAFLPTWTASSNHNLAGEPWFGAVGETIGTWFGAVPTAVDARQTAVADYSQEGFSAAAVTAIAGRASAKMMPTAEVRVRELTVRFDHPFAVVAVTMPNSSATGTLLERIRSESVTRADGVAGSEFATGADGISDSGFGTRAEEVADSKTAAPSEPAIRPEPRRNSNDSDALAAWTGMPVFNAWIARPH